MSTIDIYLDNVLIERWDDGTYTHTDFTTSPATQRPYTAQEKTDADARTLDANRQANLATLYSRMATARSTNTTFLGLTSPTNAQVVAEVQALARQNNGIMRVLYALLGDDPTALDGTN